MPIASDIVEYLKGAAADEMNAARQAVTSGIRKTAEGAKGDWRAQIASAGLDAKLANTVAFKQYPSHASFRSAAIVYSKAPEIMESYASGARIVARGGGHYLALPTTFNREGGRRNGKPKITAQAMAKLGRGWTFALPMRNHRGKLWFLRVTRSESRSRAGRTKARAWAGGIGPGGIGGKRGVELGSGRRARVEEILKTGYVPMFVLLPEVLVKKMLDIESIGDDWANIEGDLIMQEWDNRTPLK